MRHHTPPRKDTNDRPEENGQAKVPRPAPVLATATTQTTCIFISKERSKKEVESVLRQVGIDSMIDPKAKDKELLTMLNYLSNKEDKVYLNQHILKTPIVRNGKLATVGYEPNVWKTWD